MGAGADIVAVPAMPSPAQIMFAVKYVGDPAEMDGQTEHRLACSVFSPTGEKLDEQHAILKGEASLVVPDFLAEMMMPTQVILEVHEYGSHRFVFAIDDDEHPGVAIHFLTPEQLSRPPMAG